MQPGQGVLRIPLGSQLGLLRRNSTPNLSKLRVVQIKLKRLEQAPNHFSEDTLLTCGVRPIIGRMCRLRWKFPLLKHIC